jgi:hypothetical protein
MSSHFHTLSFSPLYSVCRKLGELQNQSEYGGKEINICHVCYILYLFNGAERSESFEIGLKETVCVEFHLHSHLFTN